MFKKRKNKPKEDGLIVDNKQQENRSSNISADLSFTAEENRNGEIFADQSDEVDGFDSQGFVDLSSAENKPKLLGPKQLCQYIGTFSVSLGSGGEGESTLTTHKERTRFVKKKLREYRYAQKGVGVAILISTDGIKVISPDGQRVRMAHPLQRISFATCDPEYRLFAYMSHNPSPLGTAIHCHVFMTKYTRQVQNLSALIGKAFQVAFAESKFPKRMELKMEPFTAGSDEKVTQGRRWARLEAQQGHEHSEHAILARLKKEQEKRQNKSPPTPRKQATPKTAAVETTTPPSQASPLGRRRSFGKAHTPPEVRRSNILQDNSGRNVAAQQDKKMNPSDAVPDGSPLVERKISAPAQLVQSTAQKPQEQKFYIPPDEEEPVKRERSHTPPPSKPDKVLASVPAKQSAMVSPLAKSSSDPNLLAAGGRNKHDAVSKRNSHEDENWYMPGIPREFVTEMLEKSEEGSFFVRDSQSRPGCYALTMRVPQEANPSGFGNFLIVKVKDGVMIQGFDKVLPDVTSLVEHYSQHTDGLPCKLLIGGSNVLCEDEEYMNIVPSDPDYQSLSDFTAMMAELK